MLVAYQADYSHKMSSYFLWKKKKKKKKNDKINFRMLSAINFFRILRVKDRLISASFICFVGLVIA